MTRNQIVICVKKHLDNIYPSDNHMQNAIDIIDEFEEVIRTDERYKVVLKLAESEDTILSDKQYYTLMELKEQKNGKDNM